MQSHVDPSLPGDPPSLRRLGAAIERVNRIAIGLSATGILVSLALIAWAVVMRYAFGRPPVWVDEVVGFLLVAIVMLAAADVLRRGEHIGVDIITGRLRGRAALLAQAWGTLAVMLTALIFIVNGWRTAMFSKQLGLVTEGHLEWPAYVLMLFLPLGGLLMLLTCIESFMRLAAGAEPTIRPHGPQRPQQPEDAQ
jgi:TRAP-type C4-dicarboxylate transport system permease small subunit